MTGPLSGFRIIDLTTVVLGPFATQLLADLGADVIKVEAPEGDVLRKISPMRNPGMGHIFLHHNRNKRSLVLDLKKPAGRDALLRLAGKADALVHNARPQSMKRLGLSYEEVAAANPRIVYVGAYGYSERGDRAGQPAYDDLIQGVSGLAWMAQEAGAGRPRYVPTAITDRITGLATVNAVTTALLCRERTGKGQSVEVPMYETVAHMLLGDHLCGRTFDPPLEPLLYERMLAPHRVPYATKDGYVCVLVYTDRQWRSFFKLVGREEMFDKDPRFSSQTARSQNISAVYAFIAERMVERTTAEWLKQLREADIPVSPVNSIEDVINDPHLAQSGFFQTMDHPTEGPLRVMSTPSSWSGTPPGKLRPAPKLGEHSAEVLREAGYSDTEIKEMLSSGVTRRP